MASHDVEVFGNTISGNKTASLAVISFKLPGIPYSDAGYYPFPKAVYLHDNDLSMNGTEPDPTLPLGQLMPQIGRSVVHAEGLALVRAWIASLSGGCPAP